MLNFTNISKVYHYNFTQLNILNNLQVRLILSIIKLLHNILAIHIMANFINIKGSQILLLDSKIPKSGVLQLNIFGSINL